MKKKKINEKLKTMLKSAKKSGRKVSITLEDLKKLVVEKCPILGIRLDWADDHEGLTAFSPSLDRIDSTKGYDKGNIWIISWRANKLKSDATPKELKALASAIEFKFSVIKDECHGRESNPYQLPLDAF